MADVEKETGRIAFVQSSWHKDLVDECRSAFVAEIGQLGVAESSIDFFEVTGAFEIPLHAKRLAESGRYAAIVAAGLVVDGGIYRHEFVGRGVIGGLMRVQLDTEVPVISAVLTPAPFPRASDPSRLLRGAPAREGRRGRARLHPHGGCARATPGRRPALPQEPQSAAPE